MLILFYATREQIFQQFKMRRDSCSRTKVTAIGLAFCYAVAVVAPDMTQAFGVIGGVFCVLMGWTVPFMIKIRILGKVF